MHVNNPVAGEFLFPMPDTGGTPSFMNVPVDFEIYRRCCSWD